MSAALKIVPTATAKPQQSRLAELSPLLRLTLRALAPYLEFEDVTDIVINRPFQVIIYTPFGIEYRHDPDLSLKALYDLTHILAAESGQRFSASSPSLSCELPTPYFGRVQVDGFDSVESKIAMSIRIHNSKEIALESMFDPGECKTLREAMQQNKSIFVVGATGAGKTTLCNALIKEIPEHDRIITLEDPLELNIPHKNQVRFNVSTTATSVSQVNYNHIARNILRHYPKRIIVGEIRELNAAVALELMNTGHGGMLSTFHSDDSLESAFERIEDLVNGVLTREQVQKRLKKIDLVIHLGVKTNAAGAVIERFHSLNWAKEDGHA